MVGASTWQSPIRQPRPHMMSQCRHNDNVKDAIGIARKSANCTAGMHHGVNSRNEPPSKNVARITQSIFHGAATTSPMHVPSSLWLRPRPL